MENLSQNPELVRKAKYAGITYPADPAVICAAIDRRLKAELAGRQVGNIRAIATPSHAATLYDGPSLGVLAHLNSRRYATVILLAPSQQSYFDFVSVFDGGAYETPLGRVFVELPLAQRMANVVPKVTFSASGHRGGKVAEFGIESVLPFLQHLSGDFRIVPIVFGNDDEDCIAAAGEVLAATVDPTSTLIVACSDYFIGEEVSSRKIDLVCESLKSLDWRTTFDRLKALGVSGIAPIVTITYAARRLGIDTVLPVRFGDDEVTISALFSSSAAD